MDQDEIFESVFFDAAGRMLFDFSLSGRPGGPEAVGERGKTKTQKQGGGQGPRPRDRAPVEKKIEVKK